jgi:hypothetical protein
MEIRVVVKRVHLMHADLRELACVRVKRVHELRGSPFASGTMMSAPSATCSRTASGADAAAVTAMITFLGVSVGLT